MSRLFLAFALAVLLSGCGRATVGYDAEEEASREEAAGAERPSHEDEADIPSPGTETQVEVELERRE